MCVWGGGGGWGVVGGNEMMLGPSLFSKKHRVPTTNPQSSLEDIKSEFVTSHRIGIVSYTVQDPN